MNPDEIATKADILAVRQLLEQLLQASPAQAQADDFLSVAQAAKLVGVSQKVLRGWIDTGKRDSRRKLVKLFALDFSAGVRRIPRSALVAFAQCQDFDVSTLVPAQLPEMRVTHRGAA